jgi:TPR repeat protein
MASHPQRILFALATLATLFCCSPSARGQAPATTQSGADPFASVRHAFYSGAMHIQASPDELQQMQGYYQAHKSDPQAQYWAAILASEGLLHLDKTPLELLQSASAKGNTLATATLGYAYLTGKDLPADRDRGLDLLKSALDKGESEAAIQLGRAYLHGTGGVPIDGNQAEKYLRQALKLGDNRAHFNLAEWYDHFQHDRHGALRELIAGAEGGDTNATGQLIKVYRNGTLGVKADPAEALKWMQAGARAGRADIQRELAEAVISHYGGTPLDDRNRSVARHALESAVAGKDGQAMRMLADAYLNATLDYPYDPAQALKLLQEGAQLNDPDCNFALGIQCVEGLIVPRDLVRARELIRRAADRGYAPAQQYLHRLNAAMERTSESAPLPASSAPDGARAR